ncbi:MAG: hypothetical protein HFJ17_00465 [Clostridia bacterium]|nr:hypothetical protein [Clostridia bacterium]
MEKERKYTLIPDGYEADYEKYLKEQKRKEIHERFEKVSKEFEEKKQRIHNLVNSKDKETEFKERIKVEPSIDNKATDEFNIDEAMDRYVEEKQDKRLKNLSSKVCKDGEVMISYMDKQGKGVKERFTVEEFIKKYNELVNEQGR